MTAKEERADILERLERVEYLCAALMVEVASLRCAYRDRERAENHDVRIVMEKKFLNFDG